MKKETRKGIATFHAETREAWREWLQANHQVEKSVWLIIYHKSSEVKSIYYPEAVEEALCFGWIDSVPNKRDDESFYLFFSKRNPKSNWSKVNRERITVLTKKGLMTPSGQAMVDLAKKTGTWEALKQIEDIKIPEDFQEALNQNKEALKHFEAFPPSTKKMILEQIMLAKKPETRERRIKEVVSLAEKNIRAYQYQKK